MTGGKDEPQRRRLATVKQACAYLHVGMTKFYELIGDGEIASFKLGWRTLVDLDSIDAYLVRALAEAEIAKKRRPAEVGNPPKIG